MKADWENNSDDSIGKWIKEVGEEIPSPGFTETVWKKIERSTQAGQVKYSPLIPAYGWVLIGSVLVLLCSILLFTDLGSNSLTTLTPYAEFVAETGLFNIFGNLDLSYLDNITIHNNILYAVMMLSVFLYLQLFVLTKRLKL